VAVETFADGKPWPCRVEQIWAFGGGAELPGIHSICVHPKDRRAVTIGVSCGGIWHSRDDGASWELECSFRL
jgi:hypothetical protein